jgi:enediyne biosynthesis protein E4
LGALVLGWFVLGATIQGSASMEEGPGFRSYDLRPKLDRESVAGFTLMVPATTGIGFSNGLASTLMMVNNNLMNGSGVAVGDMDGDGRPDLYFCAIDGTNALYRNLGGWRFEDVTERAGVGLPGVRSTGAMFADVNGNGHLDLLVSTLGQGVFCFRNDGTGRFRDVTLESGLAAKSGSMTLAMGDVDGDGALDLYVANYGALSILRAGGRAEMRLVDGQWVVTGPYADRLRFVDGRLEEVGEADVLYRNDGRGRFEAVRWGGETFLDASGNPQEEPLDFGLTAQIRDITGNGLPDIYVCNDFQTVDRIWLNQGGGRFRALPRVAMRKQSFSSMGVDFGDLDRDGHLDFFVSEMMSRGHELRMRQILGMGLPSMGPGLIENRPMAPRNTLFRSWGDGEFVELANYAGVAESDWTWQPVFLDVDLDGYEDILVGTGMAHDVQDRDVLQRIQAMGRLTPEQSRTNLLLYPPLLSPNVAYRNRGDLTFEDLSEEWGFSATEISHGFALADLDGDGDLDLVINCLNAPPRLYRNNSGAPRVAVRLEGLPPNTHGIGAVIRLHGGPVPVQVQEILAGGRYLSGDETIRVFAAGPVTNGLSLEVRWRSGRVSFVRGVQPNRLYVVREPKEAAAPPARLPDPLVPLMVEASDLLEHRHFELGFDDYARQPLLMRQLSQLGPGIAWVDFDGDGRDDLFIGTGRGGAPAAYRRTATGFEPMSVRADALVDDLCGVAAWFDAAGRPGLLAALANYESGQTDAFGVAFGRDPESSSTLDARILPGTMPRGASPGPVAVADMDGSGRLDVFVGGRVIGGYYPGASPSVLFRHDATGLSYDEENSRRLADAGLVSGAVWSDLDGDGYPELVLACEWGPIRVFWNQAGQLEERTEALGLSGLTGWWNGVTAADVDGDGRMDLIATNWGWNTGSDASSERPERLYYGDPGVHGSFDLIEAYGPPELGGTLAPRRSLHALGQAFPILFERYSSHAVFGRVTMDELLEVVELPDEPLEAVHLASTVFLNRGDHFLPLPLPPEAQWAPAFAAVVADFDGDGHEDVFLSQNFFAVRPEWPRLDGGRGLLLFGRGDGTFRPGSGQESGVRVYGEQRGAAAADYDGDGRVDLVVTQNGAQTRLFRNQGARPGLRVRLRGPQSNPAGVGCQVQLRFDSHWGPVREIHAGSGYWSQNSLVTVLATPDSPEAIRVRWPGGTVTEAMVPVGSAEIRVTKDGEVKRLRP